MKNGSKTLFKKIYQQLDDTLRRDQYKAWDPFDGLNAKIFKYSPLSPFTFFRLAWLQFFKRNPVNFRALTFTPKTENSKTFALLARSYQLTGNKKDQQVMLQKLIDLQCDEKVWGKGAWGYPFAWQARAFYVPLGTPNVICTSYAVLALVEANEKKHDALIVAAGAFIKKHLTRENDKGCYITYVPGASTMVHNANLWGAYVLLEAASRKPDKAMQGLAEKAIEYTLNAQGKKGEWPYGERHHHGFIDGFHSGYNLEALTRALLLVKDKNLKKKMQAAIEKGLAFYVKTFFEKSGAPKFYDASLYPIDCECSAQAVLTLLTVKPTPDRRALAEKVLRWTCENMWDTKHHHFYYQKTRFYTNRIKYLRWTQSWMHLALAQYVRI